MHSQEGGDAQLSFSTLGLAPPDSATDSVFRVGLSSSVNSLISHTQRCGILNLVKLMVKLNQLI